MSLLGGIGLGLDAFNAGASVWATRKQMELQGEAWQREDSAAQRRVADLRAAGINPVLAAGSAAASSSPIGVRPPSGSTENARQGALATAQIAQAKASIGQTVAQTDLIRAQMEKVRAETRGLGFSNTVAERTLQDVIDRVAIARDTESIVQQIREAERSVALMGLDEAWLNQVRSRVERAWRMNSDVVVLYPPPGMAGPDGQVYSEEERLQHGWRVRVADLPNEAAVQLAALRASIALSQASTELTETQRELAPWNTIFSGAKTVLPFTR